MNNLDQDIAAAIGEISKVAALINIQGKHTVFVDDSGHVQTLDIKFHKDGWKSKADATLSQTIKYCPYYDDEENKIIKIKTDILKQLKIVKDTLYKILKNDQVSMKERNYDVTEIRDYKFY